MGILYWLWDKVNWKCETIHLVGPNYSKMTVKFYYRPWQEFNKTAELRKLEDLGWIQVHSHWHP